MAPIRKLADHVVDTSEMTVHELRHAFTGVGAGRAPGAQLVVTVLSFGFKHGIPVDSDLLFDVRFLPNPHFVPALRPHTGRDRRGGAVPGALDRDARVPRAHAEPAEVPRFRSTCTKGRSYLTIGIGCTGGRHRSVAIAEALKKGLSGIPGVASACGTGTSRTSDYWQLGHSGGSRRS